jgi:hypothetical protein
MDTLAIEEDILIHSVSNREIDQYLGGDPESKLALMHLSFPEFKKCPRNLAALDEFDLVEADAESPQVRHTLLKNPIQVTETQGKSVDFRTSF